LLRRRCGSNFRKCVTTSLTLPGLAFEFPLETKVRALTVHFLASSFCCFFLFYTSSGLVGGGQAVEAPSFDYELAK